MRRKILAVLFVAVLCVGTASAQFGGVVYDPTNYQNALLRYYQLQQHLVQLQKTYSQVVTAYNLALQMSRNLHNMPARYRAQFSNWRNVTATNTYGNTSGWLGGVNTNVNTINGYLGATTQLGLYNQAALASMPDYEQARVKSQYASVELADGANMNALSTIGAIRGNAAALEARMNNLEQDSLSDDQSLNSEVAVLNKINATNVLALRSIQDSNKLLASLLEQQTIAAKQQREMTTNAINTEISLDGKLANGILDAYRNDDIIRKFLTNTSSSEIDIDVKKVSLEELQTPPYRARVDFYMVYYSPADHSELRRDLYTANFVFIFQSRVPNELIPINPLGLTISYFREDQAFK